jgi:3-oxoacyl-[acyl-carrier-protein] synthase II
VRRRVVITGIGLITCLGADPADQWRRLLAGESGIRALDEPGRPAFRHFAPVDYAAVTLPSSDRKAAKVLTRPSLLALLAAEQALADADGEPAASRRMGIYLGSGEREPESLKTLYPLIRHGRAADGSLDVRLMAAEGLRFLNPNCLLSWLPNGSLCQVTIRHGIRGANATLGEDSPNGMDAIGTAFRTIRAGRADVIVCGGTECLADPVVRNSLDVLGLLSACESGRASFRPFDVCRDGYIPGEGAAFVVVEELAQARRRGARIGAEIAGFGSGTDTMLGSCGDGIRRAVTRALQDGRAAPDAVETIVAHGSATPAGDAAELRGLRQALGAHAERVPLCAIKPATGYIGSAGDVLQALVAMWVLRDGRLPPILNLAHPDPWSTGFKFVRGTASKADVACALAVSQASVGGQASALLLRRSPYPAPEKEEGRSVPTTSAAR